MSTENLLLLISAKNGASSALNVLEKDLNRVSTSANKVSIDFGGIGKSTIQSARSAAGLVTVLSSMGVLTGPIGQVTSMIVGLGVALKGMNVHPIMLVISLAVAAGAIIKSEYDKIKIMNEQMAVRNEEIEQASALSFAETEEEKVRLKLKYNEQIIASNKTTEDEYHRAVLERIALEEQLRNILNANAQKLADSEDKARKEREDANKKSADARIQEEKRVADAEQSFIEKTQILFTEGEDAKLEKRREQIQSRLASEDMGRVDELALIYEREQIDVQLDENKKQQSTDVNQILYENFKNRLNEESAIYKQAMEEREALEAQVAQQMLDVGKAAFNGLTSSLIAGNRKQLSNEEEKLNAMAEAGIITREEAASRIDALRKEEFNKEKKVALLGVAVETALAVSKVWAQTGILGSIAMIPVLAMGAVQAGVIAAQSYATNPGEFKVVDAPKGVPVPAIVHGQEVIGSSPFGSSIIVNGDVYGWDEAVGRLKKGLHENIQLTGVPI